MEIDISVEYTPPNLPTIMKSFPRKFEQINFLFVQAALLAFQEAVPGYAPPRPNQTYKRTGTLGRSLGVAMGGGRVGKPSIYDIRHLGSGSYEGSFGSSLIYAADVIGRNQKPIFAGRWWVMVVIVPKRAAKKLRELGQAVANAVSKAIETGR